MNAVEALLRRERAVVAAGIAALTLLAWWYVWRGAGMGMPAPEMTRLALFPHTLAEAVPGIAGGGMLAGMAPADAPAWLTVLAMWWVMMIAMMTPSAAPIVLLYGRVLRHAGAQAGGGVYAPSAFLVFGYLAVWLVFSAAASVLQLAMQRADMISAVLLSSRSAWLSAAVLLAAGLYQLSPLKQACLRHCRGPVGFLTRHWRPGRSGALLMGAKHGAWCVGCCGMLMALLFVGGIMNVVWIAVLALLVLAEKVHRGGVAVSRFAGGVLIAWGVATLAV